MTDIEKAIIYYDRLGGSRSRIEEQAYIALKEKVERDKPKTLTVEGFESICESVHNAWWAEKELRGGTHPDMVPYQKLSEKEKHYDRITARCVLDALEVAYDHKPKEGAE